MLMTRTRIIRLLIGLVVLGMLAYFARSYLGELRRLPSVSPAFVAAILALYLVMRVLNGLMMKLALSPLGYVVSVKEASMLAILTTYANLLLPRAGLGLPAIYLKTKRGVSYADFTSQAMIVTTLQMGCIGACGLVCQWLLTRAYGARFDPLVALLFAAALVAGVGMLLVRPSLFADSHGRIANFLHRIADAWGRIGSALPTIIAILAWNVPMLMLRAWRLQLAFFAMDRPVTFVAAFVASLLMDLVFFVSITPGGLGFREAAGTYSAAMLGTDPGTALTATLLDRVVWTTGVVLIAQIGMWRLIRPVIRTARDGAEQPPADVKVASSLEA
jgi:uncharacterized membrane protein YbhN (UPF0104 family)